MRKFVPFAVITVVLSACHAIGLATPKSFDQQLAEAYGVHTAVVSAATAAVSSHLISSAEATVVQSQAYTARQMLDTAKQLEHIDPTSAANDLTLATTALTALQTYLNHQSH